MPKVGQIRGERRPEFEEFACSGVFNAEDVGMKSLSSKTLDRFPGSFCEFSGFGPVSGSVNLVSDQRMADGS